MHLSLFLLLSVCLCIRGCTLSHFTKPLWGPMTQSSIPPFAPNMWSSSEVSNTSLEAEEKHHLYLWPQLALYP